MKLRLFYSSHKLKQTKYETTQCSQDFPADVSPEAAYAELLTKQGSILTGDKTVETLMGLRVKVAPTEYITINSHTYVDERVKIESGPVVRHQELPLPFTADECRAVLQDSPELKRKEFIRKRKGQRE